LKWFLQSKGKKKITKNLQQGEQFDLYPSNSPRPGKQGKDRQQQSSVKAQKNYLVKKITAISFSATTINTPFKHTQLLFSFQARTDNRLFIISLIGTFLF